MADQLEKNYEPNLSEEKIYQLWEKSGFFNPDNLPGKRKNPFTIIMPPPNANGLLHMGHALVTTLEDLIIRYHRMKGDLTLWLPGADHAGIMTQVVFEKELAKQGKTRFDLGREEFFKQTMEFTMKNKTGMQNQSKKLGASCDWSRDKFTLDEKISEAVFYTFKKLYDDNLIYRGERIINWCPRCSTALSDLEVIHQEAQTTLTYIKYPILNNKSEAIIVATTRPETMLGDTAVAVNPEDERYKKFVGQKIVLPLTNRIIPIIADIKVDQTFGTGAVKVTPAHDPVDFEIGQEHKLETISVINKVSRMTDEAGEGYAGLKVKEARAKVIEELKKQGFLVKEESYQNAISKCERCKSTIEPLISKQWFVKAKILAKPAIEVVKEGKIKFIPERFEKTYFQWLENIRDWCISRQIWWGHRIPVYYCECGEIIVSLEAPKKCPKCKNTKIEQDPDTLDTWFSSGQWPFTTLGWPKKTVDLAKFYPTTVMETGWDILFFWVARMIMLGLYCTGEVPFKIVYMHGLVRDQERKKMSKSKGNVIDPLGVASTYGTDATRIALIAGVGAGNDVIVSEEKIRGYRNFCNKIWNASRFVLFNLGTESEKFPKTKLSSFKNLSDDDKSILKKLENTIKETTKNLEKYNFSQATESIYNFFWHEFCDKYIEKSKPQLKDEKLSLSTQYILWYVLSTSLKLLHPYIPFITEEIWQNLPQEEKMLMVASWPK